MATEQQIPKLVGSIVEHQGAFTALSNEDAQWVISNTKSAISLFVEAVENHMVQMRGKILEFIAAFRVEGTKRFVVKDHFKKDTSATAEVKISSIWDGFKENLLNLVEENVPEFEFRVHKLLKKSSDFEIVCELGGNTTVSLTHVWNALLLQPNGEEGNLLTNSRQANIFYVEDDAKGVVWAVRVFWDNTGWVIDAYCVGTEPVLWLVNNLVFSR